jgi:hypothetical protein
MGSTGKGCCGEQRRRVCAQKPEAVDAVKNTITPGGTLHALPLPMQKTISVNRNTVMFLRVFRPVLFVLLYPDLPLFLFVLLFAAAAAKGQTYVIHRIIPALCRR